ncbi:MAG: hypothetical protein LBR89_04625, partial [Holosporales bacterium]|nr:hypothetical protein [Holosporales bacterium]
MSSLLSPQIDFVFKNIFGVEGKEPLYPITKRVSSRSFGGRARDPIQLVEWAPGRRAVRTTHKNKLFLWGPGQTYCSSP